MAAPSKTGLIHHSVRGSQYASINYTERLAEAGIEPSDDSVGDSYDNALAETINRLYKPNYPSPRALAELRGSRVRDADLSSNWFNNRRLLEPVGNIPPAEAEER